MMNERLALKRQNLVRAWYRSVTRQEPALAIPDEPDDQPAQTGEAVDHEGAASWARSALTVSPERVSAPVVSEADVKHSWQESPPEHGVRGQIPELHLLAEQANLIVGIGTTDGTLPWIESSDRMADLATSINFAPGGQWGEGRVGTYALALVLRARQPVQVSSAEQYVKTVHDWVCDSNPIRDTQTGALLCVVALHPGGLTLDAPHAHVDGDQPISLSTLKSEVSSLPGRQSASRPYRLSVPIQIDVQDIEERLLSGQVRAAADLYDGPVRKQRAPRLLTYWRDYLGEALCEAVCRSKETDLLWRYASRFDDPEVLEVPAHLIPEDDHGLLIAHTRRAALDAAF